MSVGAIIMLIFYGVVLGGGSALLIAQTMKNADI